MHISASGAATAALRRSIMLTALLLVAVLGATPAHADNRRLNESVIANVYTVQRQAGCSTEITRNLALQLAAQWHARDAVAHRDVYGEIGSDGSTSQSRADRAGYHGTAQQTVAITTPSRWESCAIAITPKWVCGRRTASTAPSSSRCTVNRTERPPALIERMLSAGIRTATW